MSVINDGFDDDQVVHDLQVAHDRIDPRLEVVVLVRRVEEAQLAIDSTIVNHNHGQVAVGSAPAVVVVAQSLGHGRRGDEKEALESPQAQVRGHFHDVHGQLRYQKTTTH